MNVKANNSASESIDQNISVFIRAMKDNAHMDLQLHEAGAMSAEMRAIYEALVKKDPLDTLTFVHTALIKDLVSKLLREFVDLLNDNNANPTGIKFNSGGHHVIQAIIEVADDDDHSKYVAYLCRDLINKKYNVVGLMFDILIVEQSDEVDFSSITPTADAKQAGPHKPGKP